jgi:hypothetical protein
MHATIGEEMTVEFQRKRHYGSDVSLTGQASKLTKMEDAVDDGIDEYSLRKFSFTICFYRWFVWYCCGKMFYF